MADDLDILLQRVSLGDRAAFATLYDRTSAKLYSVALHVLGNRSDADEALQECFVNVWRRAARYDETRARPMTWLIAIARNAAIDRARRRKPAAPLDDVPDMADLSAISPENAAIDGDEAARLHACLAHLAAGEGELIALSFMRGLSYSEVAEAKSKPLGTVKSTIRRGLMKLRYCLERGEAPGEPG